VYKTLRLALNQYSVVPHTLRIDPSTNAPAKTIAVNLASLYHHYYLDSFGRTPPNPDPTQFEHVQFLMPTADFRIQGSGLGIAPAIKNHRSNELGQAFCRWFLHEHLNITYFAHMEHILGRQLHRAFEGCRIERAALGDAPDYFCAENIYRVFLAEAKGRYTSVSFKSKQFSEWRNQFKRVVYKDASGVTRSIKGHIIAVRYATELNGGRLTSSLFAEDPSSAGERPLGGDDAGEVGTAIIASHYTAIAEKLRQPLLAAALATGVSLPDELRILAITWRVGWGPLEGKRFVGGLFGPTHNGPSVRETRDGILLEWPPPIWLDTPFLTFFGVEETIFRQVVGMARTPHTAARLSTFEALEFFHSGVSILRDGTVLGPGEFFQPVEQLTL
jgi:hypothetical protein